MRHIALQRDSSRYININLIMVGGYNHGDKTYDKVDIDVPKW